MSDRRRVRTEVSFPHLPSPLLACILSKASIDGYYSALGIQPLPEKLLQFALVCKDFRDAVRRVRALTISARTVALIRGRLNCELEGLVHYHAARTFDWLATSLEELHLEDEELELPLPTTFLLWQKQFGATLTSLKLRFSDESHYLPTHLEALARFQNLQEVVIFGGEIEGSLPELEACLPFRKLRSLKLQAMGVTDTQLKVLLNLCPALTSLDIQSIPLDAPVIESATLEQLAISETGSSALVVKAGNLKKLQVGPSFTRLVLWTGSLESLQVGPDIKKVFIHEPFQVLRTLRVDGAVQIATVLELLAAASASLENLELRVGGSYSVALHSYVDSFLDSDLPLLSKLQRLRLSIRDTLYPGVAELVKLFVGASLFLESLHLDLPETTCRAQSESFSRYMGTLLEVQRGRPDLRFCICHD